MKENYAILNIKIINIPLFKEMDPFWKVELAEPKIFHNITGGIGYAGKETDLPNF